MNTKDILEIIKKDEWMMEVLREVEKLKLPDWWIGAGFVRSKVWDTLHNYSARTPIPDIDVIYFDKNDYLPEESKNESTKKEKYYEKILKKVRLDVKWSVTNQCRMHIFHNDEPYLNSIEAMAQWVETATCVGVKLENEKVILAEPRGINDLVNLVLRPINNSERIHKLFRERINSKKWLEKWPKLIIENNNVS
jgi:uncharacterized protein